MFYLITASLIWGFSFGLIGNTLAGLPIAWVAAARLLLAALLFLPFVKPLRFKTAARLFLIGAVQFGLMYLAYMRSFQTLKSHEVALFTIFTPIYVAIINDIQHAKFTPRNLLTASLAATGSAVILWNQESRIDSLAGFGFVQLSGICFALGQLLYCRTFVKHSAELRAKADKNIFAWLYLGGFTLLLPLAVSDMLRGMPHPDLKQTLTIIYLGVIASGIAFFLWNRGARQVSAATLAVMNNLKIPAAVLISLLAFSERSNPLTLLAGATLIVLAIYMTTSAGTQDTSCG
ncbi:MAG: EamA family transporter [Kiritimatiellae bacterium]|nr:EamA family transporter [Kiritimatiellia bacterium]